MNRLTQTILFLLLFIVSTASYAQKKPTNKSTKANHMYEDLGYGFSIEMYEKQIKKGNRDPNLMARLANSYRLNGEYEQSEYWYAQVVEKLPDPIYKLRYAQMLQINERYALAKAWFLKYDAEVRGEGNEGSDKRGKMLALSCSNSINFKNSENVTIKNVAGINTEKLDFSPTFYEDGIVFVSSRKKKRATKNKDAWINDNFMDLYYAEVLEDGSVKDPVPFSTKINSKYHEGPTSFNRAGNVMYFTRNNYAKGKRKDTKKGIMKMQIFTAKKLGGSWSKIKGLPFNDTEFTLAHPALSADGQTLVFAAKFKDKDGDMDLYISEIENGQWSKPRNLGDAINTPGDELFPFIHDDGTLYFASNGREGLGGLDIYSAQLTTDENNLKRWVKAENIGKPFNTNRDDFGFVMNLPKTKGYFTSNRKGGKGSDDIYSFKVEQDDNIDLETKTQELTIAVIDSKTGQPIPDAFITVTEESPKVPPPFRELTTTPKGEFTDIFEDGKTYTIEINKPGYKVTKPKFTTPELVLLENIPLESKSCLMLSGPVVNKQYKNNIPNATVKLVNKCTGEVTEATSDDKGQFSFCLECGCDYKLIGQKAYFSGDQTNVSTVKADCSSGEELTAELALSPSDNPIASTGGSPNSNPNGNGYIEYTKEPVSTSLNRPTYAEGMIIELEKIFYDFDKHYIRGDAEEDLDKLVTLLNRFPSMEIELSSHTDARGSNAYNEALSQRRANAAVKYIISKGIASSRIVAKGYGEKRPKNRCIDGVSCNEEEHQLNRRTEIKITKFDQSESIKVKYNETKPGWIDAKKK